MTTILDRTIRHGRSFIDYWQKGAGDDAFTVDIPKYEKFENARLDISGGRNNPQASVVVQPSFGERGKGKTVRVQWSFSAASDPANPPFVEYRLRLFTSPAPPAARKRAILVAIENTGSLPFELNVSPELKTAIESFVDKIAEFGEETNCRNLFKNYYQKVVILCDTDCTKENIKAQMAALGKGYLLDLTTLGHGALDNGEGVMILHDGMEQWWSNPLNLRESEILAWKDLPEFQDLKLGLVYMMNCQGSKFIDTWLSLGFKTAIGAEGNNWMPEPMFTFFWTRFRNGEAADYAAAKAWEDSRIFWQSIYLPDMRLEKTSTPPFVSLSSTENEKITSSKAVVGGVPGLNIM
jgi:hypothetical protein